MLKFIDQARMVTILCHWLRGEKVSIIRKPHWVIGAVFLIIFVFLLILRLGLLEKGEIDVRRDHAFDTRSGTNQDIWMNIFQNNHKIGYVHRQFFGTIEGYRVTESVFMQLNIMGMVQDIRFRTEGQLHPDLTLSSFDFELLSGLFRFRARGLMKDKILTLMIGETGPEQKVELPIQKEIHLSNGLLETMNAEAMKPGEHRTFHVFDPITTTERPVTVSVLSEETIRIMGRQEAAKKVSVDFMGISQRAWIGKGGAVLREEGALGITLEQVTREEALRTINLFPGTDLAEFASIPSNRVLHNVEKLDELRLRLQGIEEGALFLNGGRQSMKEGVLMIRKESISMLPPRSVKPLSGEIEASLAATPLIQSDHPDIQSKAKEIVSSGDPDNLKAINLIKWINQNIQKRPVLSVPSALEVLRNRVGDCNEHAVLLAALARASGIPAQVEAGLVYQKGRFYYHAWNVLYLGTWVTADATMGQMPADVTHIRLVRGTQEQVDLVGMIGKVKIEILDKST
jgi:hypothetical protein